MKKILRNYLYILMGLVLFSCKTGEVKVYSYDKATNEWAKQNLGYIRILTRNQWNNLGESRKRAAYVALRNTDISILDRMSLLLTCCKDCIGAVSVVPVDEKEESHV